MSYSLIHDSPGECHTRKHQRNAEQGSSTFQTKEQSQNRPRSFPPFLLSFHPQFCNTEISLPITTHRPLLSVKDLLCALGVTKQAINIPLRQLIEMNLIQTNPDAQDKRVKRLSLTPEGQRLEESLHKEQVRLLERAFAATGENAVQGWLQVNAELSRGE